jgi:hypothetical protein|tara:strand:+ start:742 stop:945 length:204 start_codon:yes stop_codon:yes gene_type:complete
MEASKVSGRFKSIRALLAPLDFLDKLRSFTLFDAIIPVSDPDEKAENIKSTISADSKKDIEVVPKEL